MKRGSTWSRATATASSALRRTRANTTWKKGDLIVVDHFLWHQHFNDDPVNQCRLVRVHMFDSLLETMRTLMDPMVLFEEAEDTLISMQELSQIEWPEDKRPGE